MDFQQISHSDFSKAELDLRKGGGTLEDNHGTDQNIKKWINPMEGISERHPVAFHADFNSVARLCEAADVSESTHLFIDTGQTFLHRTPAGVDLYVPLGSNDVVFVGGHWDPSPGTEPRVTGPQSFFFSS